MVNIGARLINVSGASSPFSDLPKGGIVHGLGLLVFIIGLIVLIMALMTGVLNSMAKRRQILESFEELFLKLVTYGLVGIAAACFMTSLWLTI